MKYGLFIITYISLIIFLKQHIKHSIHLWLMHLYESLLIRLRPLMLKLHFFWYDILIVHTYHMPNL